MKQLLLLLALNSYLCCSYSQDLVTLKNPVIFQIGGEPGHLYCLQQSIDLEVKEWAYDSCDHYQNRFNVTFQVHNETKESLICSKNHIVWYDAGSSIRSSGNVVLAPGEIRTFTIEVIPYHKLKMNALGQFSIQTDKSQLLIPMKLIFTCTSKKCSRKIYE
jgi:hypothetical protein